MEDVNNTYVYHPPTPHPTHTHPDYITQVDDVNITLV